MVIRRGYFYTLEAIIACILILVAIAFLFQWRFSFNEYDSVDKQAQSILIALDKSGILEKDISTEDYEDLSDKISSLTSLDYALAVDEEIKINAVYGIENLVVVEYLTSGYDDYEKHRVKLYLWP